MRKQFPNQCYGYIQGGFEALALRKGILAESLATQAMKKFPSEPNAFILSAEVAMHCWAFNIALSRWALVRKKFPENIKGYTRAVSAALELKRIPLAESLAELARKNFPNTAAVQSLTTQISEAIRRDSINSPQTTMADVLDIAEKDMQLGLFKQAFVHYSLARKYLPLQPRAFIGSSEAAMKMQQYCKAEKICEETLSLFPLNIAAYKQMFLCLNAQQKWDKALRVLDDVKKKFPKSPYGWLKAIEIQLELGNYSLAEKEITEAKNIFPDKVNVLLWYIKLPLFAADPALWKKSLDRYMEVCKKFPSYKVYLQALQSCYKIALHDGVEKYRYIYAQLVDDFLKHFADNIHHANDEGKVEKIAFYSPVIGMLKSILPVIHCFPPGLVDIIIYEKFQPEEIKSFELEKYNILFGEKHLHNYKYIVIDKIYLPEKACKYNAKFICYAHYTDNQMPASVLTDCSLFLFSSKKQQRLHVVACDLLPEANGLAGSADYKCEIGYTGPYHLGAFLERRHESKTKLKTELAQELKIDIPEDKPLIFMLEDEVCHIGQLAYAANAMSRYATVIYKTLLPSPAWGLGKFNDSVHIIRDYFAPNLMRFSADYICCGYLSGSFTTSIMLGQNVLPYYSRIVRSRDQKTFNQSYYNEYRKISADESMRNTKQIIYLKFYNEGKLLDLIDSAAFKSAILGTEYKKWYHSILPDLQKEAFGDYVLEGAPQKTAEYIMRFVNEGTLGKDCSAVYLKEKYFK